MSNFSNYLFIDIEREKELLTLIYGIFSFRELRLIQTQRLRKRRESISLFLLLRFFNADIKKKKKKKCTHENNSATGVRTVSQFYSVRMNMRLSFGIYH